MNNLRFSVPHLIKRVSYLLIFVWIFSACQTKALFRFESLKAPQIVIPADVRTAGFVDRNTIFTIDTVAQYYKFNEELKKDSLVYDSIMAVNCYLGSTENVSEYLAFDSIPLIRLPKKHIPGDRVYHPMEWKVVDSICENTGSDILICLEDIQIFNEYTIFQDYEHYGITDVNYFAVWRIYDPLLQQYHDERIVIDSLFSEEKSFSYQHLVEEELPKRKEIFRDVSYEIGKQYADLISPEWENKSRKYFIAGDSRFAVARYYLENEDWDNAIALWEELSEVDKPKQAGRACYNLALAYELKEDFNTANSWIRKSIASYKKLKSLPNEFEMIKKYAMDLVKRTENAQKLNQFFGE